ncbi:hypothetical protein Tco_0375474 [Tanacetum coccineum]
MERAKTRETSELGLVCRLLRSRRRIGAAGNLFFCHKVLGVLVLSFKGDKVLQEVSTSRFWFKEVYLVVKFDRFEQGFHQRVFYLFVQGFSVRVLLSSRILSTSLLLKFQVSGLLGFNRQKIYSKRFLGIQVLVFLRRQVRFRFVLGFKKSDYLEYKGAQENREAEVIQESNDHAAVAQRKLKVKQLKGKTNTDSLVNKQVNHGANVGAVIMKTRVPGQDGAEGNAAERYRGDNNMAALGVATLIEEYAHELLTFRDAVACEVISKWISVMKEDMDTRSSMCMLSNSFRRSSDDSNIYSWKFSYGMSVQILLGGQSTLSLEGGLSWNCDEEKKKLGFELRLVASIAICALTKVVPSPRFQYWLKLLRIGEG